MQVEELAHEHSVEVKDATLDFFGFAVKAAELPSFVARMRILSRKVLLALPCLVMGKLAGLQG